MPEAPAHLIEPFAQFGLPWRKIRVALETESEIRPIFWIDCLNDTDLHWGPLHPIRLAARLHPTDRWADVELIEDRDIPERRDFHASYHAKGHYHVKRGWVDGQCYRVPPFRDIAEPILWGSEMRCSALTCAPRVSRGRG